MRATLFADAHIHDEGGAALVRRFLEEKENVYFLGDMFDTPEDYHRFRHFLDGQDFVWIRGNHDYWLDLPDEIRLGPYLLTHGHKILASWAIEKYLVRFTPVARKTGVFGPAIAFGRAFRDGPVERALGWINVRATAVLKNPESAVIMGHLHHYFRAGNIIVLPRFPHYAVLRGSRLEIRNYLDEI